MAGGMVVATGTQKGLSCALHWASGGCDEFSIRTAGHIVQSLPSLICP